MRVIRMLPLLATTLAIAALVLPGGPAWAGTAASTDPPAPAEAVLTWGPPHKLEKASEFVNFAGVHDGELYVVRSKVKLLGAAMAAGLNASNALMLGGSYSYSTTTYVDYKQGADFYFVETFGPDGARRRSGRVEMIVGSRQLKSNYLKHFASFFSEGELYILAGREKKSRAQLYVTRIDKSTLTAAGPPVLIGEQENSQINVVRFAFSADGSRLYVFENDLGEKGSRETINVKTFDSRWRLVAQRRAPLPYPNHSFKPARIEVDAAGNLLVAGFEYRDGSRFKWFKPVRTGVRALRYPAGSDNPQTAYIDFDEVGEFFSRFADWRNPFHFDEQGRLVWYGFFQRADNGASKGWFVARADLASGRVDLRKRDHATGFDVVQPAEGKKKNEEAPGDTLPNIEPRLLLERPDGAAWIVAEKGLNSLDEIVVVGASAESWTSVIPKKQVRHAWLAPFTSFRHLGLQDGDWFLYNDLTANHGRSSYDQLEPFGLLKKEDQAGPVLVHVTSDGGVSKTLVRVENASDHVLPVLSSWFRVSEGRGWVYGPSQKQFRIGVLRLPGSSP